MSGEWLTTEPEVGMVAWVQKKDYTYGLYKCVLDLNEQKYWKCDEFGYLSIDDVLKWLPITTPEEVRLRERVSQLEDFRAKVLRAYMEEGSTNIYIEEVSKAVSELKAIEKQEVGRDE